MTVVCKLSAPSTHELFQEHPSKALFLQQEEACLFSNGDLKSPAGQASAQRSISVIPDAAQLCFLCLVGMVQQ